MTVPSGRATSGARSVLRAVFCGVFAIVGLVAGGCGNTTFYYGTVVVTVSADNPSPFTAYVADIASISFLKSDNTSGYGFSNSTGYGKTIDFTKLADSTELFGAPAVLEGTYTQVTITMNYGSGANSLASQIYVDINGVSQAATLLDFAGATPGTMSYTVKLDPAKPLVVSRATPVKLDLHFSMSASTMLNTGVSPITATVRPVLTASTQPDLTKPLRTRGVFVVADTGASNFTINSVAFFDSASYTNAPQGAIQVQTTAQTAFNVNGVVYRGAAGLAALVTLPVNTIVQAYGSLGDITQQKPVFNATEVYAGVAAENVLASRVTGTVASRTGNTFHLHNAELIATNNITASAYALTTPSGVLVRFFNDMAVTVNANTLVDVDREPEVASNLDLISIGQKVEIEGVLSVDSAGTSSLDASGGLVRLTPTTAWGDLTSGAAGSATVNLLSLGDADTSALTFTGTGAATGEDADPNAYTINTGTVDLTGGDTTFPWRFDGLVAPFGSAAPGSLLDFTATAVTAGSATEQVLEIEWAGSGTTAPFTSSGSSGLVVNIGNTSLGKVRVGPAPPIDLKGLAVNPTIVADGTLTGQFSTGNPVSTVSATLSSFQTFADYLTQLNTVINGTNTVLKLAAVGHWEGAPSNTFTAYRIDVVQTLP
jgi:hypothetical protein